MKNILLFISLLSTAILLARSETTISGKLLGVDGKPMAKSNVHLVRFGERKPLASVGAASNGAYTISTKDQGLFLLQFTGVNHELRAVPLLAEKSVSVVLDVRLSANPYLETIAEPKIIGDFNKFSFGDAKPMKKELDGTFVAEFETNNPTFSYQILGALKESRSVNGTQSENYEYDGGGDYRSIVVPKNGKIKIVFDPAKLVRSTTSGSIVFDKKNADAEHLAKFYDDIQGRRLLFQKAMSDHRAAGKEMKDFKYDWSSELTSLAEKVDTEKDPAARQLWLIDYLDICSMSPHMGGARDTAIAQQAIKEIGPTSWFWSLSQGSIFSAMRTVGKVLKEEFLERLLSENPDANLKSGILFNRLMNAKFANDTATYQASYRRLVNEFGDTQYGRMVKERFSLENRIQVGRAVPNFSVASLDDAKVIFSNEILRGRVTLIDFWAVWCGPCVAEMDNLHKAFDRFSKKNFQILSLSFDPKPQDVREFREKKWKMPWLHAFVEKGFESDMAKQFEVMGIPRPILVDGEGKIIALESDLRGEQLEKTLERVLAN